jgi:hypothetical protein
MSLLPTNCTAKPIYPHIGDTATCFGYFLYQSSGITHTLDCKSVLPEDDYKKQLKHVAVVCCMWINALCFANFLAVNSLAVVLNSIHAQPVVAHKIIPCLKLTKLTL